MRSGWNWGGVVNYTLKKNKKNKLGTSQSLPSAPGKGGIGGGIKSYFPLLNISPLQRSSQS